jgi:tetratricopeptide (TPR) repeat protein
MTFDRACPSCGATLGDDGICVSCGSLSRGFFRGLELGAPQIAAAVARGLDFYRLLDVDQQAEALAIARQYRRLRALFPDDPSSLAPEPRRKFELLQVAGRVLTDPALRALYDQLRTSATPHIQNDVLRCPACGAPLHPEEARCLYCGSPRPAQPAPPVVPPLAGPPAVEPIDFYTMLGLAPMHLLKHDTGMPRTMMPYSPEETGAAEIVRPPTPEEIDAASYALQQATLLQPGLSPAEREARVRDLEIARRVLGNERLRSRYDGFWQAFHQGRFDHGHLEGLRALIEEVRAEDEPTSHATLSPDQAEALLQQGRGLIAARLPREAIEPLRRACAALPGQAEAHALYASAILASADPLDLGAHALRQALTAIETAARLGDPLPQSAALLALCRGLLARDAGDMRQAESELSTAAQQNPTLAAAWRGLAALAIGRGAHDDAIEHCQRALKIDPRDERAWLMLAGACLRDRRYAEARAAAEQVAGLRGGGISVDAILADIGN